jgi:hypothetical protein
VSGKRKGVNGKRERNEKIPHPEPIRCAQDRLREGSIQLVEERATTVGNLLARSLAEPALSAAEGLGMRCLVASRRFPFTAHAFAVPAYAFAVPAHAFAFLSRRLFDTTLTELAAIAAAAIAGVRSRPKAGYSAPAAIGMPMTL